MEKLQINNYNFYRINTFPRYYASYTGNIYDSKTNKFLKLYKTLKPFQYSTVYLHKDRFECEVRIAEIIADMFIPNINKTTTVMYIDNNTSNNNANNLIRTMGFSRKLINVQETKVSTVPINGVRLCEIECSNGVTYESIYHTSISLNIEIHKIEKVILGKSKNTYGYIFKIK